MHTPVKAQLGDAVVEPFGDDTRKNAVLDLCKQVEVKASRHHVPHEVIFEKSDYIVGIYFTVAVNRFFVREGNELFSALIADIFHPFKNLDALGKLNGAVVAEQVNLVNIALKFCGGEKHGGKLHFKVKAFVVENRKKLLTLFRQQVIYSVRAFNRPVKAHVRFGRQKNFCRFGAAEPETRLTNFAVIVFIYN